MIPAGVWPPMPAELDQTEHNRRLWVTLFSLLSATDDWQRRSYVGGNIRRLAMAYGFVYKQEVKAVMRYAGKYGYLDMVTRMGPQGTEEVYMRRKIDDA